MAEKTVNPNKPVRTKQTPRGVPPVPPPRPIETAPKGGKPVRPNKTPARVVAKHPDVGKAVWMSCRGVRPCGGSQAIITMKSQTPGGGWSVRYECQKCKTSFGITT